MKKIFLLVLSIPLLFAEEKVTINNNSPGVQLVSSNIGSTVLEFNGGDFTKSSVRLSSSIPHLDRFQPSASWLLIQSSHPYLSALTPFLNRQGARYKTQKKVSFSILRTLKGPIPVHLSLI